MKTTPRNDPSLAHADEAVADTLHGVRVADPFRSLENVDAPATQAWMREQDGLARRKLQAFPGHEQLAQRFRQLYYVDSISPPVKRGGRFFYTRTHADKEMAVVYWRNGEHGIETVLFDPNTWSSDGTISLGVWVPSWDGKRVVYALRANAADEATLRVLEVDTGEVSKIDVIPGGKYAGPSWTPQNDAFYYEYLPTDTKIPVADRPGYTEIRLHKLGESPAKDQLVYPRTGDASTFLGQSLSRDGRYLFVYVTRGWNENDIYVRDLTREKEFHKLVEGKDATYGITVWKDMFYIVTDEGAPKKRVFKVAGEHPERTAWKEVVPEDKTGTLDDVSLIGDHLVLTYLKDAANEIRIVDLDGRNPRAVPLPGIGSIPAMQGNPDEDEAYFAFSSFTTPLQVYRTSVTKIATSIWASVGLPIDSSKFEVEQIFYNSKDGTRVPMFIVHRKGMAKDGANPTLLYGYGGFNVSLTPDFRASIYPWIEAGGVYAIANIRGGGEYGKEWHDAGRGAKKQNVFDDFAAGAEYLIREKWTKPEKLAISGGSNGGLLVGATMTQRPELFRAVVCSVPLLDMVRFHLFGSGKTWTPEYGSAENAADFPTLYAYSPYHHISAGVKYPALLMMSSDHDDRVDPMHARKFVARLEAAEAGQADALPVLLRIEQHAGHHGADQVSKAIDASADMYSFLFMMLGVQPAQHGATP